MRCHSQIISVTFIRRCDHDYNVDFLCLDFDVQLLQEKPKIAFSAVVVNSINYSSFQRRLDVAAPLLPHDRSPTKIAMAHQRAAKARLYKLPLDAAVQSRRPDLIEFGGLPALALPRDICRSRDRAAKVDRAPAQANAKQP